MQGCYLLGLADPSSILASDGLIDATRFDLSCKEIRVACEFKVTKGTTIARIRQMAASFSKASTFLSANCKLAGESVQGSSVQTQLHQLSNGISATSATLAAAIKALMASNTEVNQLLFESACRPMMFVVNELIQFLASSEGILGSHAVVGSAGLDVIKPILHSAEKVARVVCEVMSTCDVFMMGKPDAQQWQRLGGLLTTIMNGLKDMVRQFSEKQPGLIACQSAVDNIEKIIADLELVLMPGSQPTSNSLERGGSTANRVLIQNIEKLLSILQKICEAAKQDPIQLSHLAFSIAATLK